MSHTKRRERRTLRKAFVVFMPRCQGVRARGDVCVRVRRRRRRPGQSLYRLLCICAALGGGAPGAR